MCAILFLSFTGCSFGGDEKVILYEMESYDRTKQGSKRVITDVKIIDIFERAQNEAVKQFGIADMLPPHYKVVLRDMSYFLWLYEEDNAGRTMNVNNTHTVYSIDKKSLNELSEALRVYFPLLSQN